MSAAKVTVGIPTYNRSAFLRQSITSVLAQSYPDFRLLISDNASEDDTPDVVREFDDSRIEYVRATENCGPFANFNRLIAGARTDYLLLLPDDDLLYEDNLAALVPMLERHPGVGLVHSEFDLIDAAGDVDRHVQPMALRDPSTVMPRERALEWMMSTRWAPSFPTTVYRTRAIAAAGGLREQEGAFGDMQLFMRIARDWDFAYVARSLGAFRTHPQTITAAQASEQGVEAADGREQYRLYSQMKFEQRLSFVDTDGATLPVTRRQRLRALAKLTTLAETAGSGSSTAEVVSRLRALVRSYPPIVLRPALWRLVLAQLGGRQARAALRRVRTHSPLALRG